MNVKDRLQSAIDEFPIINEDPLELYEAAMTRLENLEKAIGDAQDMIDGGYAAQAATMLDAALLAED